MAVHALGFDDLAYTFLAARSRARPPSMVPLMLWLRRRSGKTTVESYTQLLRDCGFVDVQVERLTLGIAWVVRASRPETA